VETGETWRREVDDDLGRCCHLSTRALNSTKVEEASQSWPCPSPRINVRGPICRVLPVPIYKGEGMKGRSRGEKARRGKICIECQCGGGYDDKTEDHAWSVVEEDRWRKQRRQGMECGDRLGEGRRMECARRMHGGHCGPYNSSLVAMIFFLFGKSMLTAQV
jgi:hypothetical protein